MKEKFDLEKQSLKQELDEMKVHLALGRADAITYLEEKKADFARFVDEVKHDVSKLGSPVADRTRKIHEKLDHLKVQLALGRMESHDAYCAQRTKIVDAIDEVERDVKALANEGESSLHHIQTSFTDRARSFRTQLESATLSLGAGVMLAKHELEETVEIADIWLEGITSMTLEEIQEARKYIKQRVALHSKKGQV